MTNVLVIGSGNVLRGDDGVGWRVAEALLERDLPGVTVLARHQLTPELADDLAAADLIVFVDGDVRVEPGRVTVAWIQPASGASWTHHLEPSALLALAELVSGRTPPVAVVSIGIGAHREGEGLSPCAVQGVGLATHRVLRIVARGPVPSAGRAAGRGRPASVRLTAAPH